MTPGQKHMQRVAQLGAEWGCVVCASPMAHVHHLLADRTPGRKASDWLTVPLCYDCHVGTGGIHGTRQDWKMRKLSETQALAKTLEALYGEISESHSTFHRPSLGNWGSFSSKG
jgi:hypothetical protein